MSKDRLICYAELAELVGVSVGSIQHGRCGTAEIPRIKSGRRVLFSLLAVERWIAAKARQAEREKERERLDAAAASARERRRARQAFGFEVNK